MEQVSLQAENQVPWAVESRGVVVCHPKTGGVVQLVGEEAVLWDLIFRRGTRSHSVSVAAAILGIPLEHAKEKIAARLAGWRESGLVL
jgi:hypothetical protein